MCIRKKKSSHDLFDQLQSCYWCEVKQSLRPCPVNMPDEFENTPLFLRLGLSSIMEMQIIKKSRSSNWRNLKILPFLFHVTGKHFKNKGFQKWLIAWCDNLVNSLTEISSNTNPKWLVIVVFLNSSSVAWMENIWCVVRVKHLFSNPCGIVYMGPKCGSIFLCVE